MSPAHKLALGTVQFGLDYGISNDGGQVDPATVAAILETATTLGVDLLDTARAYGTSETVLGTHNLEAFRVVTKLAPGAATAATVATSIDESLRALRCSPDALLYHRSADYLEGQLSWREVSEIAAERGIHRLGFSLYEPDELRRILDRGTLPAVVQVPYNLFDRRFTDLLTELHAAGTEVHVRSAFLQGLFFRDPASLPPHFSTALPRLRRIHALAEGRADRIAALALGFVVGQSYVDRVVVGVVSPDQLRLNIEAVRRHKGLSFEVNGLICTDLNIINPSRWP